MKYSINYKNSNSNCITTKYEELSIGGEKFNIVKNKQKINEINLITARKKRILPDIMLEYIVDLCSIKPCSAKELADFLNRDDEWVKREYISNCTKDYSKIKISKPFTEKTKKLFKFFK